LSMVYKHSRMQPQAEFNCPKKIKPMLPVT
jgi:hypothetical protein